MRTLATVVVMAGAALTGCVSEAAYQEALRDARQARMEAAERDQRARLQQSQIDWLAARLQERDAAADPRAAAELARALRELSAWSASFADRLQRASAAGPPRSPAPATGDRLPETPGASVAERGSPFSPGTGDGRAVRPLDAVDPWTAPRRPSPAASPRRGRGGAPGGLALAAQPLDEDDPWSSLGAKRPPLDSDDPWRR